MFLIGNIQEEMAEFKRKVTDREQLGQQHDATVLPIELRRRDGKSLLDACA
jgi:hypothetical protein